MEGRGVKEIPREARITNLGHEDAATYQRCRYCLNTGFVTVALRDPTPAMVVYRDADGKQHTRAQPTALMRAQEESRPEDGLRYEEAGPCPMCQLGYDMEFPPPTAKNPNPKPGAWGADGYWRGQEWAEVLPMEEEDAKPLPKRENARRMRELSASLGRVGRSMEGG
jgi:hypothetical protein